LPCTWRFLISFHPKLRFSSLLNRFCLQELIDAESPSHAAAELADVMFFALTAANVRGASLADADKQLDLRTLRV
jgi:hypothetical protein